MQVNNIVRLAALLGALTVALGAFGAHGLQRLVEPAQVATFNTGVRYQFYHTLALGLAAALLSSGTMDSRRVRTAIVLWMSGMLLFSGSLYLLSLRPVHGLPVAFLGPVTPIGGLLLIGGWAALFFAPRGAGNNLRA